MPEAGGGKNRDFYPPQLLPSVEVRHANHPLFLKVLPHVLDEKFFIEVCDPYKKFCKYLKFQNRNSATNENNFLMYKRDLWAFLQ